MHLLPLKVHSQSEPNGYLDHKGADWLHNPCRLGGPQRFRAGNNIRSGPQMGELATSPVLSWGSP